MGKVVDAPASADSKVSWCYNHTYQFSEVLNRYNALPILVHPTISREKASPLSPSLSLYMCVQKSSQAQKGPRVGGEDDAGL